MMDIKGKDKPIFVVALKGHPGTGKSTLAEAVAKALKWPLIDKDHFRDGTHTIEQALRQVSPTIAAKLLNDLSYEAMWKLISTQLRLGLSVVVDSPLSRRANFDKLVSLASKHGAQLIVVECRPGDVAEWRRRVETRGEMEVSSWHKPVSWHDMDRLLESYGGCWDYDMEEVPKLVMDTTGSAGIEELVDMVIESVYHHCLAKAN